jgi:hypothetical protein
MRESDLEMESVAVFVRNVSLLPESLNRRIMFLISDGRRHVLDTLGSVEQRNRAIITICNNMQTYDLLTCHQYHRFHDSMYVIY